MNKVKPLLERFFIVSRINELLRQERAFEKVFCHERVRPYRLTYEDLIAAPARQASLIADHIGVAGVDFSAFDIKEATIQPTQRGINRYYELLTIMSSGTFWDLISRDPRQACGDARWRERRSLAVGHRTATGRVPGEDRNSLCDRIESFIHGELSCLSAAPWLSHQLPCRGSCYEEQL